MRERATDEAPIGVLEIGARADLVVVTDELDVVATWINGKIAYDGRKLL
jgi:N-acetylglucosamine-6-phosphate deacetylase